MIAQLGDIIFEGLNTPVAWSESHETKYAEIPHVGGKASLQKAADELLEINLDIRFFREFCTPADELDKLKKAMYAGEVVPFVTGEGGVIGKFLLKTIEVTTEKISPEGVLYDAKASITLVEFVPPPTAGENKGIALASARPRPQIPATAKVNAAQGIGKDISKADSAIGKMKSSITQARKGAKSFKRTVREVRNGADAVKSAYSEAKSKLTLTKRIIKRASKLPLSLDEGIRYAENLGKADSLLDLSVMDMKINALSVSASKIHTDAAPVAAYSATREGGN